MWLQSLCSKQTWRHFTLLGASALLAWTATYSLAQENAEGGSATSGQSGFGGGASSGSGGGFGGSGSFGSEGGGGGGGASFGGMGPGAGGFGGGGYGGGFGGGGYGAGGSEPFPLEFKILGDKDTPDDAPESVQTASRVFHFRYHLGSLKPPTLVGGFPPNQLGAAGEAGPGGMRGRHDNRGGGMMAGMSGSIPGMGMPEDTYQDRGQVVIRIAAYVFDDEQVDGRTRIEVLTAPPNEVQGIRSSGMGMMGSGPGMGGDMGMMGGGPGVMGGGMGMMMEPPKLVRLTIWSQPSNPSDKPSMSEAESQVVTQMITQKIWKADVVKSLAINKGAGDEAAKTEQLLKALLTEEYDTQLARQELMVQSIQQRMTELKAELARRRAAKERVIDVQLGRIMLEAQGLLGP